MSLENDFIANRLKVLRAERTCKELADALGISVASIYAYESGRRVPNDALKLKIADYYGVSVDSIFFTIKKPK